MIIKKLSIILFSLFLTSCGFKVANYNYDYNFTEISITGDDKIGYRIKNKLLADTKKENSNRVLIKINLNKIKSIKEKNISNEVTKYEIKINTNVEYEILSKNIKSKFDISKKGDYLVMSKHSDTLNNEKNLINLLSTTISEEILSMLASNINDL
tara:strand:+ start:554 stop:1018 length:465 start_codon:yes stop_codon:yes gene_type:complete